MMQGATSPFLSGWLTPPQTPADMIGQTGHQPTSDVNGQTGHQADISRQVAPSAAQHTMSSTVPATQAKYPSLQPLQPTSAQLPEWYNQYYASQTHWGPVPGNPAHLPAAGLPPRTVNQAMKLISRAHEGHANGLKQSATDSMGQQEDIFAQAHNQLLQFGFQSSQQTPSSPLTTASLTSPFSLTNSMPGPGMTDISRQQQHLPPDHTPKPADIRPENRMHDTQRMPPKPADIRPENRMHDTQRMHPNPADIRPENRMHDTQRMPPNHADIRPENRLHDTQRMPPPSADFKKDFTKFWSQSGLPPVQSFNHKPDLFADKSLNTQFPPNKNIADFPSIDMQSYDEKLPGAPKVKKTKKQTRTKKESGRQPSPTAGSTDLQATAPIHTQHIEQFQPSSGTGNFMQNIGSVGTQGVPGGNSLDVGRMNYQNSEAASSHQFHPVTALDARFNSLEAVNHHSPNGFGRVTPQAIGAMNQHNLGIVTTQNAERLTPHNHGRVTPQDIDRMTQNLGRVTPKDIDTVNQHNLGRVTPQVIGSVTPQDIGTVNQKNLGRMTPQNIDRLTPQNLDRMTPQNLDRMTPQNLDRMTPQNLDRMTPHNLDRMTPQNLDRMKPPNLDRMTPQNLGRVTPQNIGGRITPQEFVGAVNVQKVGRVTSQDISAVGQPDVGRVIPQQLDRVKPQDIGRVTPQNVTGNGNANDIVGVNIQNPGRMNSGDGVTPQEFGKLHSQDFNRFNPYDIHNMNPRDIGRANTQATGRENSQTLDKFAREATKMHDKQQDIGRTYSQGFGIPKNHDIGMSNSATVGKANVQDIGMFNQPDNALAQQMATKRQEKARRKPPVEDPQMKDLVNEKVQQILAAYRDREKVKADNISSQLLHTRHVTESKPHHPMSNIPNHPSAYEVKAKHDLKEDISNIINSSRHSNITYPESQPLTQVHSSKLPNSHDVALDKDQEIDLNGQIIPGADATNPHPMQADTPSQNSKLIRPGHDMKAQARESPQINSREPPCCRECEILGIRFSANCKNRKLDAASIVNDPYSFDDSEEKHPYFMKQADHRTMKHPDFMTSRFNLKSHNPNLNSHQKQTEMEKDTNGIPIQKDSETMNTAVGEAIKDVQKEQIPNTGDTNSNLMRPSAGNMLNPAAAFRKEFSRLQNLPDKFPTEHTGNTLPNFASSWGHGREYGSPQWPQSGQMYPSMENSAPPQNKSAKRPANHLENGQLVKRRGRKPGSVNKKKMSKSKSLEDLTKIPTTTKVQSATVEFPVSVNSSLSQSNKMETDDNGKSMLLDSGIDMKINDEAPVTIPKDKVAMIADQVEDLKIMIAGEDDIKNKHLVNNQVIDVPDCGCRGPGVPSFNEATEGPYYTHLGAGRSVKAIRDIMEARTGVTGKALRIEKIRYSGKEGKSSQGCPIAKWVVRRSGLDEKYLCVVRHRVDHFCETAWLICAIVAWEGVPTQQADDLYDYLINTVPENGFETERRCGTNERKTCACQGVDLRKRGASFSFGCSWSMYFNGCKFARSQVAHKFKMKDTSKEPEIEEKLQNLANRVGPLYDQMAPEAHSNQCFYSKRGRDCRLGEGGVGPFSGVTACVDFCAHAHKDVQNMNNGSTVVVTLTKHRGIEKPDDEQLHVLPLYVLETTDEFDSEAGQYAKIQSGALEVLHQYQIEARIRAQPLISAKRRRRLEQEARRKEKLSPGKRVTSPGWGRTSPWGSPPPSAPTTPQKSKQRKDTSFLHSQDSNQSQTDSQPSSLPGSAGGTPVKLEKHKGSKKTIAHCDNDKPLSYEDLMSASNLPGFSGLYDSFWEYFYSYGSFPPPSFLASQPGLLADSKNIKPENIPSSNSAIPTSGATPTSSATSMDPPPKQQTADHRIPHSVKQEVNSHQESDGGDLATCNNIPQCTNSVLTAAGQIASVERDSGSLGGKYQLQTEQSQNHQVPSKHRDHHGHLNYIDHVMRMSQNSSHGGDYLSFSTSQSRSQSEHCKSDPKMAATEQIHTPMSLDPTSTSLTSDNHTISSMAANHMNPSMSNAAVLANDKSVDISSEKQILPLATPGNLASPITSMPKEITDSSVVIKKQHSPSQFTSESALDLSNSGSHKQFQQEIRKAADMIEKENTFDKNDGKRIGDAIADGTPSGVGVVVKSECVPLSLSTCMSATPLASSRSIDGLGQGQRPSTSPQQPPQDTSGTAPPSSTATSTSGTATSSPSDTRPSYHIRDPFSDSPRKVCDSKTEPSYQPTHRGHGGDMIIQNGQQASDRVSNSLNKNSSHVPCSMIEGESHNTVNTSFSHSQGHVGQGHPDLGPDRVQANVNNNRSHPPFHPSQGSVGRGQSQNIPPDGHPDHLQTNNTNIKSEPSLHPSQGQIHRGQSQKVQPEPGLDKLQTNFKSETPFHPNEGHIHPNQSRNVHPDLKSHSVAANFINNRVNTPVYSVQGHTGQGQSQNVHPDLKSHRVADNCSNDKVNTPLHSGQGHTGQGQSQNVHPDLKCHSVAANTNNRVDTPLHPGPGHTDQRHPDVLSPNSRQRIDSSTYQGYNGSMYDYDPPPLANNEKMDVKGNFLRPDAKMSEDHSATADEVRCETEYNEEPFKDPTVGGVAIALCHGAVLFEVAKRELHATTGLRNPDRYNPTRISLVFYQHKNMNFEHHGMYRYAKKLEDMKQKRLAEMQEKTGGTVNMQDVENTFKGGKKKKMKTEPTEDAAEEEEEVVDIMKTSAAQYRYMWPCNVRHATAQTTNSVITRWIDPQPMVSGPYQKWV